MAFKRSAVRSRLSPPQQINPNLVPVGEGFGFICFSASVEEDCSERRIQKSCRGKPTDGILYSGRFRMTPKDTPSHLHRNESISSVL